MVYTNTASGSTANTATFTTVIMTNTQVVTCYIPNRELGFGTVKRVRIIVYRCDDVTNNTTVFWAADEQDTTVRSNRRVVQIGECLQTAFDAVASEVRDMMIMLDMMEV